MLERSVDDSPGQASIRFTEVHEQFADHLPVSERDYARAGLESRIGDEAWNKTRVQRPEIAQRIHTA